MLVEHFPKMWLHLELLHLIALQLGKATLQRPYLTHLIKMQAPPCVVTFDSGPLIEEGCTIKAFPYIHVWNAKCTTNCLPSHDNTKKCAHVTHHQGEPTHTFLHVIKKKEHMTFKKSFPLLCYMHYCNKFLGLHSLLLNHA